MIGREDGGLYILSSNMNKEDLILKASQASHNASQSGHSTKIVEKLDIQLLHQRLGHVSSSVLQKMFSLKLADVTNSVSKCTICPYAKQIRLPFRVSTSSSLTSFDLLHMDIWGPYKKDIFDEYKYFLTMVDDYSRMTWVFLLRLKFDVCTILKDFLTYVRTQFNKLVKIVRSDNGTEFVNANCKELFKSVA